MPRILIVEDDPDLRFLYQAALSQDGFDIIEAPNATVAKAELEAGTYDLMLLDLNMPDAHGTEVIDFARQFETHDRMAIVVITANDHWLGDVYNRGIEHILVKPVSMGEVLNLVNHLLE